MKTERQISSGGVIFRRNPPSIPHDKSPRPPFTKGGQGGILEKGGDGGIEVALIAVKGGSVWTLPKGQVEKGENIARTAHREVKEETGLDGKIIKLIDHIQYFYAHKEKEETRRFFKVVYFFLMEYSEGDVQNHDFEVDDCQWFPIDDAIKTVEYKDEKEILKKAKKMIAA